MAKLKRGCKEMEQSSGLDKLKLFYGIRLFFVPYF